MLSIEHEIRHMNWANHKFFTELAALPAECLQATYGPADWTVAHIALHMVGGFEWYRFLLTEEKWTDPQLPKNAADILAIRDYKDTFLDMFLKAAAEPERSIEVNDEFGHRVINSALPIQQAIYHSTEHRAHMATAIEVQGIARIHLDGYDFWNYYGQL